MKRDRLIYWIATGLFSAMMLASATMYLVKNDMITGFFVDLGYPTYLVYPLAAAKILGVVAIVTNINRSLKEWAYAGFFFDFLLAFTAHVYANDDSQMGPVIAAALLFVSYFFWTRIRGSAS